MIDVPIMAAASCITRIGAFNTCPFAIPSGWQKLESSLPSEASATVTTVNVLLQPDGLTQVMIDRVSLR